MYAARVHFKETFQSLGETLRGIRKDLQEGGWNNPSVGAALDRIRDEQVGLIRELSKEINENLALPHDAQKCAVQILKLRGLLCEKKMEGSEGYKKLKSFLEKLQIVSTPRGDKKRKERSEQEVKPQASTQVLKKKKEMVGLAESSNTELANEIEECFGISRENINEKLGSSRGWSQENLATISFELTSERLLRVEPVKTEEIKKLHHLLFETAIRSVSEQKLGPVDFVKPHPAYVIYSLFQCITALGNQTCQEIAKKAKEYLGKRPKPKDASPALEFLLNSTPSDRAKVLVQLNKSAQAGDADAISFLGAKKQYEGLVEKFEDGIKQFPVISSNHSLKGNNVHKTYMLRDAKGQNLWVFKPEERNGPAIPIAEHAASLVNHHYEFPIPLTLSVEIGGWTGSAQFYVEGTQTRGEMQSTQMGVEDEDVQKLAIFDLLFANSDRHLGNILFIKTAGKYRACGIDHDSCLMKTVIRPLKLEYQSFEGMKRPFIPRLKALVNPENVKKYESRLRVYKNMDDAVAWMQTAANALNQAMDGVENVCDIITNIKELWDKTQSVC